MGLQVERCGVVWLRVMLLTVAHTAPGWTCRDAGPEHRRGHPCPRGLNQPVRAGIGRVCRLPGNPGDVEQMGTRMFNRTRIMTAVAVPAVAALGVGALATAPAANATPVATAQVATPASTRLLVVGDRGSDVRAWQQDLDRVAGKIAGVPRVATDGAYGPRTAAATRAFQRYAHLPQDGVVGPNTRRAMTTALHGSPTPAAQPILRRGDHGQAVRGWQTDLDNLSAAAGRGGGLGTVVVDGSFGPKTEALTIALQKREHIAPDGIVGPNTRAAYLTLLASEKKTNS